MLKAGGISAACLVLQRKWADGFTWVILCNTRSKDSQFYIDLEKSIKEAINNPATKWPEVDLF